MRYYTINDNACQSARDHAMASFPLATETVFLACSSSLLFSLPAKSVVINQARPNCLQIERSPAQPELLVWINGLLRKKVNLFAVSCRESRFSEFFYLFISHVMSITFFFEKVFRMYPQRASGSSKS
jgi:hypothetical protein